MSKKTAFASALIFVLVLLLSVACVPIFDQEDFKEQDWAATSTDGKVRVLIGFEGLPDPALVRALGGEIYVEFSIVRVIAAELPVKAAEALSKNPKIAYVELDGEVHALGQTVPWGIDRVFGNESYSFSTWNTSTGSGITVAILDTGIDSSHEDLGVIVAGGANTVGGTSWNDGHGHGTHVAGTVAALDNPFGVVGIAPGVSLYAVKVLDDSGSGSVSSIVAGIEWAVKNDINIINMSLGSSQDSQTLHDACDAAYGAGLLIISSAGNSGNPAGRGDNVGYPAEYSSVVAVAASDSNDRRASFSSTGPAVELIAPGVSVLSTTPNNTYSTYSGTSMASPHVAGVAALVWAVNPELTNAEVRQILIDTAENLGLSANHQGYGLVRADLAVDATGGSTEPEPDPDPEPEPEPEPGDVIIQVSGIVYATRANNRHLDVSLTVLEEDSTKPVSNASVSVELYRNNALYANRTGTTGTNGTVTFSFNNAPSGTYSTVVKSVTKDGYLWYGGTPDNTFTK